MFHVEHQAAPCRLGPGSGPAILLDVISYLVKSVLLFLRDPRGWAWSLAGAFLLWVGASLDVLAIGGGAERVRLLGWGTIELVTTLGCLGWAARAGAGAVDGDLEDVLVGCRLGPVGLSAAQGLAAMARGTLIGLPVLCLLLVFYMNMGTASMAGPTLGSVPLWLLSLGVTAAWGLALGRALGPAAGFLTALCLLVATRAGVLPGFATGLAPPPITAGADAAAVSAAVLAGAGLLATAAALRAR
jgi:hypothetical protein